MPLYDVSVPVHPGMPVYPGDPPTKFAFVRRIAHGAEANNSWLSLGSHAGTHIDAPLHFIEDGASVDAIGPEVLVGPCRLIDVGEAPIITRQVLEALDLGLTDDPEGARRLLFRTRNSRWIAERFEPDFVAFSADGAAFLAEEVRAVLIGIDAPSLDPRGTPGHPAHMAILGSHTIRGAIEWLALDGLEPGPYTLFCGPLPVQGAEAAPCRVFLAPR